MAMIGYARVSTQEQNLDLQLDALEQIGCDQVFEDQGISATAKHRPGFETALGVLKPGDTFVIWKLDRAFRSAHDALATLEKFEASGIAFHCITEPIETRTAMGRAMYQVRNVFSELEKNMMRERTVAGMDAARRRGKQIGRPRKLTPENIAIIRRILENPNIRKSEISDLLNISQSTLTRALSQYYTGEAKAKQQANKHPD